MNVNPVNVGVSTDSESANAEARAVKSTRSSAPIQSGYPDLGTEPEQEVHSSQTGPPVSDLSRDEVQVQRDGQSNDEIVIRYVDGSGNLILQIPSSQVLSLARAIEQTLADQASERAAELAQSQGGKSRGH